MDMQRGYVICVHLVMLDQYEVMLDNRSCVDKFDRYFGCLTID